LAGGTQNIYNTAYLQDFAFWAREGKGREGKGWEGKGRERKGRKYEI
jgi:hypothetical protein